jgi:hypothetical protein
MTKKKVRKTGTKAVDWLRGTKDKVIFLDEFNNTKPKKRKPKR